MIYPTETEFKQYIVEMDAQIQGCEKELFLANKKVESLTSRLSTLKKERVVLDTMKPYIHMTTPQ